MSTIDSSVSIYSATGTDGNSYTTSVSNDTLSSDDFIQLMITELSLQDPTKPVDSSTMSDSQLQSSTIEANYAMVDAMESLTSSFNQTTLSDSTSMIGRTVENGNTNEDGELIQYQVSSMSSIDGSVYATAYELLGYDDMYYFEPVADAETQFTDGNDEGDTITITTNDGTNYAFSTVGKTYSDLADEINATDGIGADIIDNTDGPQLVIAVAGAGSSLTQTGIDDLKYSKDQQIIYSTESELLEYTSISKVY